LPCDQCMLIHPSPFLSSRFCPVSSLFWLISKFSYSEIWGFYGSEWLTLRFSVMCRRVVWYIGTSVLSPSADRLHGVTSQKAVIFLVFLM
jgi:hypothetical protein